MTPPHSAVAIDCYVRASTPSEVTGRTIQKLQKYDREGRIDDLTVQSWPSKVALTDDCWGTDTVERFETFRAWAERHAVRICPPFEIREQTSLVDDDSTPMVVLPTLCLAIYIDGKLESVFPHRSEKTEYTVGDAMADLAEEINNLREGQVEE